MESPQHDAPLARERAAAFIGNRRLLGLLITFGVMATVVVIVIGFSTALYTSTSSSPGNSFTAGAIDLRLATAGQIIDGAAFAPGVSRSGTQTVTNVEHRADVHLAVANLAASAALGDVLRVVVTQTAPAVSAPMYDGTLRNLIDLDLGLFAAAEKRTYRIDLTWPASQNNPSLQGATVSFTFVWRAVSVS